ncbi:MAG: hypothetical protein CM1200mP6_06940 [Anaerolineaceae bacterium]|nr:MAG: hypothetical protein CM1200mP6_06940 [Anaerolineaceae bacterium]
MLGGLATAYAIEQICNISPKLKWPNDIWIEQKKIAGILVETSYTENLPEWQILGVGINVNSRPLKVTNPSYDVSCLADIIGHKVDRVNYYNNWYTMLGYYIVSWTKTLLGKSGRSVCSGKINNRSY